MTGGGDRPEPRTVRQLLLERHFEEWHRLETGALGLLEGTIEGLSPGGLKGSETRAKHDLLSWALSDSPEARTQWDVLVRNTTKKTLTDRDRYVAALWETVSPEGTNKDLHGLIHNKLGAYGSYQTTVFTWFLRRFDLGSALKVWTSSFRAALFRSILPLALLLSSVALLGWLGYEPAASVGGVIIFGALLLATWALCRSLSFGAFVQALLPRLGAGVAIGYLFLAAAPDLVRAIVGWGQPQSVQWSVAAAILAAVWAYAAFHIGARVHPTPRTRVVAFRALATVWFAVACAAVGLVFFSPLLFSSQFLSSPASVSPPTPPDPHSATLVAAVALALGLILELAWEERPLTEPL